MINITVGLANEPQVKRFLNELPHRFNQAITNAVNETATKLRREARKEVKKELNIQKDNEEYKMKIEQASVFTGQIAANLIFKGSQVPLSKMSGAIQKKEGVRFDILGKAHSLPGSFFAKMKSGHRGVFTRENEEVMSLPINERFTASIPQMAVSEKTDIPEELQKKAQETFEKVFVEECAEQLALMGAK